MRPPPRPPAPPSWSVLHVYTLAALLLLATGGKDSGCRPTIEVRRHSVYKATVGKELCISCKVYFCDDVPPTLTWSKLNPEIIPVNTSSNSHIRTEWNQTNGSNSYLIFHPVHKSDLGMYRCSIPGSVSHSMNVTVEDTEDISKETQKNGTRSSAPDRTQTLMYVYSTAGIASFVIIVIVLSVVSMRGCKGKSRKEAETEYQVMMMPVAKQQLPRTSPRGSPAQPPSRRSTRRKTPSRQGGGSAEEEEQTTDNRGRSRETAGEEPEEGAVLVYAALNHQPSARGRARPGRSQAEETSEYAAIRIA